MDKERVHLTPYGENISICFECHKIYPQAFPDIIFCTDCPNQEVRRKNKEIIAELNRK